MVNKMKNDIKWESKSGKVDIVKVKEFEVNILFKFPKTYINLVSTYDGARVSNHMDSFNFFSNFIGRTDICGIGCFLSFDEEQYLNTSKMKYYWETRNDDPDFPFPEHIVPFAVNGGGEQICFDYRHNISTNEPKIVVWHNEAIPGSKKELSYVADSFDEFLDMLYDSRTEEQKEEDKNFKWSWEK
jgi:hypothetical protein